jgi:hypothetical protein
MKDRAINKIKAKITQKELDLKQSLIDKKNKIGFLNEEQHDSLTRHHHKEIKIYQYILNKIQ